MKKGDL